MCSIQGRSMIYHVCNGGHEGQYLICCEESEPIHIMGRPTALDGHETHHEVLKVQFGPHIMP